ncbi:lipid IV(A) 3-deoxy-D-manno-octulosonic acid transferase [Tahibacter amnicola]|uniref:lipid IV(A) 3-deoxy-D-manno-octulosonic acid transferase n=1 Tax=Tahibacter amnicola TaxID=2976241 RepID=UPI0031BA28B1
MEALMRRHPDCPFVITTITPTGSERVQHLFGDRVFHVYLPYDLPASVRRFLDRVKPKLGVIMETEIWPNLYHECARRRIPLVVANARLSQKSLRGYGPVRPLARLAIRSARHVAAQSSADAQRLLELGADPQRLSVLGNIKFDMAVPEDLPERGRALRAEWGLHRPVWIAASTHEGEEVAVLKAHAGVLRRFPDALLLIAPRHPERFRPVAQACKSFGFATRCRTEDANADASTQCFVVDTLGELLQFYATADVAFVGGSLVEIGGHNVLEPAALSVPVIVGPNTFNFAEITENLLEQGGARQLRDADALGAEIVRLLADERSRLAMGDNARQVFDRERGAVERNLAVIEHVLAEAG